MFKGQIYMWSLEEKSSVAFESVIIAENRETAQENYQSPTIQVCYV